MSQTNKLLEEFLDQHEHVLVGFKEVPLNTVHANQFVKYVRSDETNPEMPFKLISGGFVIHSDNQFLRMKSGFKNRTWSIKKKSIIKIYVSFKKEQRVSDLERKENRLSKQVELNQNNIEFLIDKLETPNIKFHELEERIYNIEKKIKIISKTINDIIKRLK